MKIRATRADLADAVAWVSQATPKKFNAPALAGVKITADAEAVTLSCFSYETAHTAVVACDVPSAGECLVSAHLLREILAALKSDVVELTLDGPRLSITSGRSTYRLGVMALEEYPSLPAFPKAVGKVARDDLADLIGTVQHAAAKDDMVPQLAAVHVVAEVERLHAQTTDRFRIADAAVPWSADGAAESEPVTFEALIPLDAVTGALKGLRGSLAVGYDSHLFGLSDGSRTVTTRCLDLEYPKIDRLLLTTSDVTMECDAETLAGALKRAELVNERNNPLLLAISADEVAITADADIGNGVEYVACAATGDLSIGFNGAFLSAGLLAVGGTVRLAFTTAVRPVLITSTDESRDVRTLVMPRKVLS